MKTGSAQFSSLSEKDAPQPSNQLDVDGVFCLSEKSFLFAGQGYKFCSVK
jgi:hypothetical protein